MLIQHSIILVKMMTVPVCLGKGWQLCQGSKVRKFGDCALVAGSKILGAKQKMSVAILSNM